jgi:hypothetical protein
MKTLITVLSIVSLVLILFTIICGLWIRGQGANVEVSSLNFHLGIALLSAGSTLLTLILALNRLNQLPA